MPDSQQTLDVRRSGHHGDPQTAPSHQLQTRHHPVFNREKPLRTILPKPEQNRNQRQRHPQLDPPENPCRRKHPRHRRLPPPPPRGKKNGREHNPSREKTRHSLPATVHAGILSEPASPRNPFLPWDPRLPRGGGRRYNFLSWPKPKPSPCWSLKSRSSNSKSGWRSSANSPANRKSRRARKLRPWRRSSKKPDGRFTASSAPGNGSRSSGIPNAPTQSTFLR